VKSLAENIKRLGGDLITGHVSDALFFEVFETRPSDVVRFGLEVLQRAMQERDDLLIHFGMYVGHRFGFSPEHLPVLMELAEAPWHTDHENVVMALSDLRSPMSVDVLYRTALAKYDYLDDDDEIRALGVKCLWALGNIATESALARIEQLAHCGVAVLETNAVGQLARMLIKGPTEPTRALAASLLEKREHVAGVLNKADETRDPALLTFGLSVGRRLGFPDATIEPLAEIARCDFHQCHDEVLAALASIPSDAAVRELEALAQRSMLREAATRCLTQIAANEAFPSELRALARAASAEVPESRSD
jgi:hypothetical protein